MRTSVALLAALTIAAPARPADPSPEQKVLDQFTGTWKSTFKTLKSEWTPEEVAGTSTVTGERVLGGAYLQEKHANGDGTSGLVLRTYDPERKAYRGWWFSSAGHAEESVGTWDEKTGTFTWKSEAAGRTMTITQKFADADTLVWDVAVKAADGKVLFRMEGKATRVKEGKK
jgi:hypothetical protein